MDYREELVKQVNQLLRVLRQALKTDGYHNPLVYKDESGCDLTLNIYLCDHAPGDGDSGVYADVTEENDDSEDWYLESTDAMKYELTKRDLEFLKANGLTF